MLTKAFASITFAMALVAVEIFVSLLVGSWLLVGVTSVTSTVLAVFFAYWTVVTRKRS